MLSILQNSPSGCFCLFQFETFGWLDFTGMLLFSTAISVWFWAFFCCVGQFGKSRRLQSLVKFAFNDSMEYVLKPQNPHDCPLTDEQRADAQQLAVLLLDCVEAQLGKNQ